MRKCRENKWGNLLLVHPDLKNVLQRNRVCPHPAIAEGGAVSGKKRGLNASSFFNTDGIILYTVSS
jgi:hypothetical protein